MLNEYGEVDIYGAILPVHDFTGMTSPVICTHCHQAYDLAAVTTIARYSDATVFTTPCSSRTSPAPRASVGRQASPNVASVSATGEVTALTQGTTTPDDQSIVSSSAVIAVKGVAEPVLSLQVLPGNARSEFLQNTVQFIATATSSTVPTLEDYTGTVKWASSNVEVATISQTSLATVLEKGTTAVTAEWTNPDGTVAVGAATLDVTPQASSPQGISTLTVFGLGSGSGWTITASSATGVANEINCLSNTGSDSVCVGTTRRAPR